MSLDVIITEVRLQKAEPMKNKTLRIFRSVIEVDITFRAHTEKKRSVEPTKI